MARPPIPTPTPVPTSTPTPPPAPPPPPAPVLSPITRRRTARTAPPARIAYTRYATAGERDDRIVSSTLATVYKVMAWVGGTAVIILILFGGFQWGKSAIQSASPPALAVTQLTPLAAQPPAPSWPSRDECERHYVLAPAPGRCR